MDQLRGRVRAEVRPAEGVYQGLSAHREEARAGRLHLVHAALHHLALPARPHPGSRVRRAVHQQRPVLLPGSRRRLPDGVQRPRRRHREPPNPLRVRPGERDGSELEVVGLRGSVWSEVPMESRNYGDESCAISILNSVQLDVEQWRQCVGDPDANERNAVLESSRRLRLARRSKRREHIAHGGHQQRAVPGRSSARTSSRRSARASPPARSRRFAAGRTRATTAAAPPSARRRPTPVTRPARLRARPTSASARWERSR